MAKRRRKGDNTDGGEGNGNGNGVIASLASEMFQRLAPKKRQQVIEAAAREFAERGLDGARIRNLSAACGVSRGSLYDYFRNKEELLEAVARVALAEMAEHHEAALQQGGDFFTRLERVFHAGLDYIERHPYYAQIYLQVAGRGKPLVDPAVHWQAEQRAAKQYREMIEAAIETGELRPDIDPHLWAFTIDSMWTAYATCLCSPHLQLRLRAYFELPRNAGRKRLRETVDQGIAAFLDQLRAAIGRPAATEVETN